MNAHFPPPQPDDRRTGDPLIDQRLARLQARRTSSTPTHQPQPAERPRPAEQRSRRAHAARGSRTAALAMSVTATVGLAAYLQQADAADESSGTISSGTITSTDAATATTAAATTASTSESTTASTTTPSTTAVSTAAATDAATGVQVADETTTSSSGLADGTFTGDVSTNRWGDVQVQITVADGAITDVTVLEYPDEDGKSVRINQQALPTLISETLTTQSSDVDTVSGATYTSESYRASLQTAIDDARAAATA